MPDADDIEDAIEVLEELEDEVSGAERGRVYAALAALTRPHRPVVRVVSGFDLRDAAEAFIGSVVVGLAVIVEDGTFDIGAYIAGEPVFYLATLAGGVALVSGILYATDYRDVRIVDPFLGVIPRRLLAIFLIAFATSALLTTIWGRVDWATPWTAWGQVTFVAMVMAVGAAVSDILPG